MDKKQLTPHDNRPFFEKALSYGVQQNIIPTSRVDEILGSGPKGIVQIAKVFGTPNLRPDLVAAQNRIVNLVSLYLENTSEWDLGKAAQLLKDNNFLTLSKGGSEMIKYINSLPDAAVLGKNAPDDTKHLYDVYASGREMVPSPLEKYSQDKQEKMKNQGLLETCVWFLWKFAHIDKEDFDQMSASWLLNTLIVLSTEGFNIKKIPTENRILNITEKLQGKEDRWDALKKMIPEKYLPYMTNAMGEVDSFLENPHKQSAFQYIFEADEYDENVIDLYENDIIDRWQYLTNGKKLTQKEERNLLLSSLCGDEPEMELTTREMTKMTNYLVKHTPDYEEIFDEFIENSVPPEHREGINIQRSYLSEHMDTLYDKNVDKETKMWILQS